MSGHSGVIAVDNLKRALKVAVARYFAMTRDQFIETVMALCAGHDFAKTTTIQEAMIELAGAGSIEALAVLAVLDTPAAALTAAALALATRSQDVREGLVVEELARMLEEHADEEVAAGRMEVRIDPATGKRLYSFPGEGKSS